MTHEFDTFLSRSALITTRCCRCRRCFDRQVRACGRHGVVQAVRPRRLATCEKHAHFDASAVVAVAIPIRRRRGRNAAATVICLAARQRLHHHHVIRCFAA